MEGSLDKEEPPRSHAEIDTILNNLKERLNAHDNHMNGNGVIIGEFAYTYFGNLKDDVLNEIPRGGFGIFVDAWSLCAHFNMDYTSESSFLERGKTVRGEEFMLSGEALVESTFDQQYLAFIVGHSTQDVAVGTLLPGLSTLGKFSWARTFGTRHKLEIELKNARTQFLEEIHLDLQGRIQIIARTLLDSSYDSMTMLLIHTNSEIRIM